MLKYVYDNGSKGLLVLFINYIFASFQPSDFVKNKIPWLKTLEYIKFKVSLIKIESDIFKYQVIIFDYGVLMVEER